MLRMFQHLTVPRKILIGPWVHSRPNVSVPGPRIDYAREMARFFARWLRDEDDGFMDEPAVAAYMQEFAPPRRTRDVTPGSWRAERAFPPQGAADLVLHLGPEGVLADAAGPPGHDEFDYLATVGVSNGYWSAGGLSFYLAEDQRPDEARSLCYTSAPLARETHLLGWPRVILHASSTARVATFVAKLSDVAPDGASALIVDGSLNATRRASVAEPSPLEPGTVYELDVPMAPTGYVLGAGHRLRLALAGSDFPNLWPTPEPARNRIYRGAARPSRVILPVVGPPAEVSPVFAPPPSLDSPVRVSAEPPLQQVIHDQVAGTVTMHNRRATTTVLEGGGGALWNESRLRATATDADPAQASVAGSHRYRLERPDGTVEVVAESVLRATADAFHLEITLAVTRNGAPYFSRSWTVSEPRRLL